MVATAHQHTLHWRQYDAGQVTRCQACGRSTFGKVLPRSVTFICPAPAVPPSLPGGKELQCRNCKARYWEYTMPSGTLMPSALG